MKLVFYFWWVLSISATTCLCRICNWLFLVLKRGKITLIILSLLFQFIKIKRGIIFHKIEAHQLIFRWDKHESSCHLVFLTKLSIYVLLPSSWLENLVCDLLKRLRDMVLLASSSSNLSKSFSFNKPHMVYLRAWCLWIGSGDIYYSPFHNHSRECKNVHAERLLWIISRDFSLLGVA